MEKLTLNSLKFFKKDHNSSTLYDFSLHFWIHTRFHSRPCPKRSWAMIDAQPIGGLESWLNIPVSSRPRRPPKALKRPQTVPAHPGGWFAPAVGPDLPCHGCRDGAGPGSRVRAALSGPTHPRQTWAATNLAIANFRLHSVSIAALPRARHHVPLSLARGFPFRFPG
jgi:hypothetical protein